MSLLESVITGKTPKPPRVMIYGYEGVGKSQWAASAPNPIFIQTEDGLSEINCKKFPLCKTWSDVVDQMVAIRNEEHDFQTLVIDSLSGLEPMIWEEVCKSFGVKNIEKVDGGFGRGYKMALDWWRKFVTGLGDINVNRNMMIILTAHVGTQDVKDPETATYDRTAPLMNRYAAGIISQWCDCIFQAKQKFRIQKAAEGFGNSRNIAAPVGGDGGERVIRTIGNAAVIAKNRYGIPEEIPLDFNIFMDYLTKAHA